MFVSFLLHHRLSNKCLAWTVRHCTDRITSSNTIKYLFSKGSSKMLLAWQLLQLRRTNFFVEEHSQAIRCDKSTLSFPISNRRLTNNWHRLKRVTTYLAEQILTDWVNFGSIWNIMSTYIISQQIHFWHNLLCTVLLR